MKNLLNKIIIKLLAKRRFKKLSYERLSAIFTEARVKDRRLDMAMREYNKAIQTNVNSDGLIVEFTDAAVALTNDIEAWCLEILGKKEPKNTLDSLFHFPESKFVINNWHLAHKDHRVCNELRTVISFLNFIKLRAKSDMVFINSQAS